MKQTLPLFCFKGISVSCLSIQKPLWGRALLVFFLAFLCLDTLAGGGVQNVFAGRKSILLPSMDNVAEGEKLSFRVTKDHRALASGTVKAGKAGRVELPVLLPGMKPGVAMQLELSLSKISDGASASLASGMVWAFAEQPFAFEGNPASMPLLYLYDPEGKTSAAFESIKLRVQCVDDFSELESVTNAFIVIHEGFSIDSVRGFDEILDGFVRHGNRVLLIAPSEGAIIIPSGLESCWYGITLKGCHSHAEILGTDYDLDLSSMPGCRFRLVGIHDEAALQVDGAKGYEAAIWWDAKNDGKVIFCGLNLISSWEKTPAARWLLGEILLFE